MAEEGLRLIFTAGICVIFLNQFNYWKMKTAITTGYVTIFGYVQGHFNFLSNFL